jgi:hypothetical protein
MFTNLERTAKKTQPITIEKINWIMLFTEIIALYSANSTKPTSTLNEQTAELLNGKRGGTYNYHSALKVYHSQLTGTISTILWMSSLTFFYTGSVLRAELSI